MTGKEISSPDMILLGERAQQFDMLLHVQEFSTMSVLITGPSEIGKTTLLKAAADQLSVHHQVVFIDAVNTHTLADILESIALDLGCEANLVDLDTHLIHMSAQNETLHLLIDDAHLLDGETLQFFLEKSTLEHGWHLILSGEASLKARLDVLQSLFENKLYHLIELNPYTEEESEAFVAQLYQRAGMDVIPISHKDLHQLWQLSKGIPGKLLELIELEQDQHVSGKGGFPLGHIAAVLLVGSALLVSLLYQADEEVEVTPEDKIAELVAQKRLELQQQKREQSKPAETASDLNQVEMDAEPKPIVQQKPQSQADDIASVTEVDASQSVKIEPEPKPEARASQKVATSKQVEKVTFKTHPLMNMPEQSFALQLLGVRSEENAKSFVERFSRQIGSDKLNIYETRYRGEPWFVVVYGPIDNKALANEQANKLSKTIKSQPWVRPISKIQDDIRQIEQ